MEDCYTRCAIMRLYFSLLKIHIIFTNANNFSNCQATTAWIKQNFYAAKYTYNARI